MSEWYFGCRAVSLLCCVDSRSAARCLPLVCACHTGVGEDRDTARRLPSSSAPPAPPTVVGGATAASFYLPTSRPSTLRGRGTGQHRDEVEVPPRLTGCVSPRVP